MGGAKLCGILQAIELHISRFMHGFEHLGLHTNPLCQATNKGVLAQLKTSCLLACGRVQLHYPASPIKMSQVDMM